MAIATSIRQFSIVPLPELIAESSKAKQQLSQIMIFLKLHLFSTLIEWEKLGIVVPSVSSLNYQRRCLCIIIAITGKAALSS